MEKISEYERNIILHSPYEIDLVYSGLEDTMINSFHELLNIKKQKNIENLRIAAFTLAIQKIYNSYQILGIFP